MAKEMHILYLYSLN